VKQRNLEFDDLTYILQLKGPGRNEPLKYQRSQVRTN